MTAMRLTTLIALVAAVAAQNSDDIPGGGSDLGQLKSFEEQTGHGLYTVEDNGISAVSGPNSSDTAADTFVVKRADGDEDEFGPQQVLYTLDATVEATTSTTSSTSSSTTSSATSSPTPDTCEPNTSNESDDTLTLEFYAETGCCDSFQTMKIGNIGDCHDTDSSFSALSQAVGQNMFGWQYNIEPYSEKGCGGDAGALISLTNKKGCTENDNGNQWNSFKVSQSCNTIKPSNSDDNAITLALYRDGDCCVPTQEGVSFHDIDSCQTPEARFGSISQAVGSGLFNRDIVIQTFTEGNCGGDMHNTSLTNKNECDLASHNEAYASYRLHQEEPPCMFIKPDNNNNDGDSMEIAMYSDDKCCKLDNTQESVTPGKCHNVPAGQFKGFNANVGQNLIDQKVELWFYTESDCSGTPVGDAVNKDLLGACAHSNGGDVKSFQLVKPEEESPPEEEEPDEPWHVGCVSAHCSEIAIDNFKVNTVVQLYQNGNYIIYLSRVINQATDSTKWTWTGAKDPDGDTWDVQMTGNCGTIIYQTSKQGNKKGWVALEQSKQTTTEGCASGSASYCINTETSSWDSVTCEAGSNPGFCDFDLYCDPAFYPGEPVTCYGETCGA